MKVILEAFGGRLRSDVMEWPENKALEIKFPLDIDTLKPRVVDSSGIPDIGHGYGSMPDRRWIGVFQCKHMHQTFRDSSETAVIYTLVDIYK